MTRLYLWWQYYFKINSMKIDFNVYGGPRIRLLAMSYWPTPPSNPRTRATMLPTPPTHTSRHPRHPRYLANSRYNLHSTKVHPDQKGIDIMTSNLISFFEWIDLKDNFCCNDFLETRQLWPYASHKDLGNDKLLLKKRKERKIEKKDN